MEKRIRKIKKQVKGITLVVLVVTIIVLLILAGIVISLSLGENGIFIRAKEGAEIYQNASENERIELDKMSNYIDNYLNNNNEEEKLSEVEEAIKNGTVYQSSTIIYDKYDNPIKIPAGFKLAKESGNTVQQGIVIEDVSASADENVQGSQYVWIPVGRFTKDDRTISDEIILGRYTFDEAGTAKLQQAAYTEEDTENYKKEVIINFGDRSHRRF